MRYPPELIMELGNHFIDELSHRPDCKTAVRELRKQMTTFALQAENHGYVVTPGKQFMRDAQNFSAVMVMVFIVLTIIFAVM